MKLFSKKNLSFISYRNISTDSRTYPNFDKAIRLSRHLVSEEFCDDVRIAPPEYFLPEGALLSPSDIINFIKVTRDNINDCTYFVVLKDDYFTLKENSDNAAFTSMWTEAEVCLWQYRAGKELVLYVASEEGAVFIKEMLHINPLDYGTHRILARIFVNLEPGRHTVPYNWGKYSNYRLLGCRNPDCKRYFLINTNKVKEHYQGGTTMSCPFHCGNTFTFKKTEYKKNTYWVNKQLINSQIDPFPFREILPLLILTKEKEIAEHIKIVD